MNIANVTNRFAVLADIDSSGISRWATLVEDACRFVQSLCRVENPNSEQTERLEMLSAAYALRLYMMCGDSGLTHFVAGDVKLTSSADRRKNAMRLWQELAQQNADLIRGGGFVFGRVIS